MINHPDTKDLRYQHVPIPRFNPKERTIATQKAPLHPIVYEGAISGNRMPEKSFKAIDEYDHQFKFEHNNTLTTLNQNVLELPGNSLDIEPKNPNYRDPGVLYEKTNAFTKMGQYRNEQFLRSDGSEITRATLDNSKYGPFDGAKKSTGGNIKRMQPIQELLFYENNAPSQNLDKTNHSKDVILWRNFNQFDGHPAVYENRNQIRDYRFEKRKERQEAYQKRRETKKAKDEALMNIYLRNKNAYFSSLQQQQPSIYNNAAPCLNPVSFCQG